MSLLSYYMTLPVVSGYDPHALAFLQAAAIPDDSTVFYTGTPYEITGKAMSEAVNELVVNLKAQGVWAKLLGCYPVVGGTVARHRLNLISPSEGSGHTNLTIQFSTADNHTALGMDWIVRSTSTVTAWANINPFRDLSPDSNHLSYYTRGENTTGSLQIPISALDGGADRRLHLTFHPNKAQVDFHSGDAASAVVATPQAGFIIGSRTAINMNKLYRHGALAATVTKTRAKTLPNLNMALGYSGIAGGFAYPATTLPCAFATIGHGLTDTEALSLHSIVQTFQTTLKRQV
jgi:hypothetical protein